MAKLRVELAKLSNKGSAASIYIGDSGFTVSAGMSLTAREACKSAAKSLRDAADRFDLLAECKKPFAGKTHRQVNGAKLGQGGDAK